MHQLVANIPHWIESNIAGLGYLGIVMMMAIESACVPLPSEIIMPFGGYLVYRSHGAYSVWWMAAAGALGCLLGSVAAYWAGYYGGRPFVERYGKYVLVRHKDLDHADAWFARYGDAAIFFSRLLPVIRTFISFPAGISRMKFGRFSLYTVMGSFPWCLGLAYVGMLLGAQWDTRLKGYFHGADIIIGIALAALLALYILHRARGESETKVKG